MKDRISASPGRVLVKPENGGADFYATLERADNPIQEGDALNKANLLTDATAALLGLGENAVPDDVFGKLGEHRWKRRAEETGYEEQISDLIDYKEYIVSQSTTSSTAPIITVYYGESYSIGDGVFAITNPIELPLTFATGETGGTVLLGKYFTIGSPNESAMYTYGNTSYPVTIAATEGNYRLRLNSVYEHTLKSYDIIGEYEYVTSPNRHEYPDSGRQGIFTYEYLGSPLENAKEAYGMRLHWWKRRTEESGWTREERSVDSLNLVRQTNVSGYPVYYSDEIEMLADGKIKLLNHNQIYISYNSQSGALENVANLAGKYFSSASASITDTGVKTVYFGSQDILSKTNTKVEYDSGTAYYIIYVTEQTAISFTYVENLGEYEYVFSTNRNAYPDSGTEGIFSYQYLGVPFENAREGAKVVTGSYVGTGTYGASNPCSLTFDFAPKFVWIYGDKNGVNFRDIVASSNIGARVTMEALTPTYTLSSPPYNSGGLSNAYSKKSEDGKTLSWYNNSANYQFNASGTTYFYLAIG